MLQHHDEEFTLFPLVSYKVLYLWLPSCVGITLKPSRDPLNHMVNPPAPFTHQKGMLSYHTLLLFLYTHSEVDKLTLTYFGNHSTPCPNMAMPGSNDTSRDPSKLSHDALFLKCEVKSRVGSDWLIRSSKLQPCLELCRFFQVLLKTKFAKWKAHFLLGICEMAHVQHSSERMAYDSRCVTGKKSVALGVS
jgi:hypothetical protein